MSEKRFGILYYATPMNEMAPVIFDNESGVTFQPEEAANRLNALSERIEVLREWIRNTPINDDFEKVDEFERKLIRLQRERCCVGMDTRVELARRRIAALEGKHE